MHMRAGSASNAWFDCIEGNDPEGVYLLVVIVSTCCMRVCLAIYLDLPGVRVGPGEREEEIRSLPTNGAESRRRECNEISCGQRGSASANEKNDRFDRCRYS